MAPKRRQTKSKYTLDRCIPGAFEGETVTRRRFMTGTVHGAGMLMTAGSGLSGLRERVGAAGGTMEVGPVPPRGWRGAVRLSGAGAGQMA